MKPWERFGGKVEAAQPTPTPPQEQVVDKPWNRSFDDPEIAQLKADEGYRSERYKDTRGVLTIGFGTAATSGREIPEKIDEETATQWMREDVKKARESVAKLVPDAPMEVQNILTNMTYQMGATGVKGFKATVAAIKEGDYEKAAEEMRKSVWFEEHPTRASRLIERMRSLNSSVNGGQPDKASR